MMAILLAMNTLPLKIAGIFVASGIGAYLISFAFNGLRRKPGEPSGFSWDSSIELKHVTVDGNRLRYIEVGSGSPLVLLHTLRTHIDLFQKVIPDLAKDFTVYAVEYPGHGWSDIPAADYTPQFFASNVAGFLDALRIERALVVGESIGGTIPLLLAAEKNARISAIVSVNPYDYDRRFTMHAGLMTRIMFGVGAVPIVGGIFMRFRLAAIEAMVMAGGVANRSSLPKEFLREMYNIGVRLGHYQGFLNLIRHLPLWSKAHDVYDQIDVPVLLIYGDEDWSAPTDRERTSSGIPGVQTETVSNAGHFLSLDQPEAFAEHVRAFARYVEASE